MIPIGSTTIDVLRDAAPEDDSEYIPSGGGTIQSRLITVENGVRANIGSPSRYLETIGQGSEQMKLKVKMQCDPCDITHLDFVRDNKTSKVYNVAYVLPRDELGIKYMQCELVLAEGTETGI